MTVGRLRYLMVKSEPTRPRISAKREGVHVNTADWAFRSLAPMAGEAAALEIDDDGELSEYPFKDFVTRPAQERVLREWLLGGNRYDPNRDPLGGAALVTGFRGVGKTTLVNKVLFDVGVAGLYGYAGDFHDPRSGEGKQWGPFSADSIAHRIHEAMPRSEEGKKEKAEVEALKTKVTSQYGTVPTTDNPTGRRLYLPIYVPVPNVIEAPLLMHRILRRTCFALVEHQIGELRPDIMRRSRLAYIRTLGALSIEANEKVRASLGMTLDSLGKLEVTGQQEVEFSETLKLACPSISVEEAEDELLEIGARLTEMPLGGQEADLKRLRIRLRRLKEQVARRIQRVLHDSDGKQVHLVYVFDELDKLPGAQTESETHIVDGMFRWEQPLDSIRLASKSPSEEGRFAATLHNLGSTVQADPIRKAQQVVERLKILFSDRGISAVVIGGVSLEEKWQDEVYEMDPKLRSIFSRHVYVPLVD